VTSASNITEAELDEYLNANSLERGTEMNSIKGFIKTVKDNREVIIRRSLQGAALAAGYFVATAVGKQVSSDTIVVEGDAVINTPEV
jgi:hypothetical protein